MDFVRKYLPGFCFVDPTNNQTINIRFASINLETRLRPIWTPEIRQDLESLYNIETELTTLITQQIRDEIDQQIIQDVYDNQRFYNQNNLRDTINRWVRIEDDFLTHNGHRAPQDNTQPPNLGLLPLVPRTFSSLNLDVPQGINYNQYEYYFRNCTALPNEEGWFTNGTFESLLIKTNMRPYDFLKNKVKNDIRGLYGL